MMNARVGKSIGEHAFVKGPLPEAAKPRFDRLCRQYRQTYGLHYGQTMAACLLVGIRTLEHDGAIPHSILAAVRS